MECNDSTNNTPDMWDWQEHEYCIQRDSHIDCTHSLWDEVIQNEDSVLYMLQENTPIKDCMDLGNSFCNTGDGTKKGPEELKKICHFKRRRVLQFNSESSDSGMGNERYSSCCLNTEVRDDPLVTTSFPDNSCLTPEWDARVSDDRSIFGSEGLEQLPEGWLGNCFNESNMQCNQEEMNDLLTATDPFDVSEFYHAPTHTDMETDMAEMTPSPAPQTIFKGKKSLVKTPLKLTTSIAYPFALIKPCGVQGDVTLKDINQRIHGSPISRSINKQHEDPSASYPTSAFSGKPVVVKTKIRTEGGKGSITIMRTKG